MSRTRLRARSFRLTPELAIELVCLFGIEFSLSAIAGLWVAWILGYAPETRAHVP